jgi:hypothetical protein
MNKSWTPTNILMKRIKVPNPYPSFPKSDYQRIIEGDSYIGKELKKWKLIKLRKRDK